jgi:FSR family fosmidomycin resistance protein-like MFS transporter
LSSSRYGVLPQFAFARLSHHLCTGTLVPLLPLVRQEFALSYFQAGLLTSAFALAYGFTQLPIVALSRRIGERTVIIAGLIGMSIAAMAAGSAGEYNQLLASLVLMGLCGSGYHALAASFLSRSFSKERRGQMLGLHLAGSKLSFLIAPFLAVLIASLTGSWRSPFIVLALPALLAGVLLWATVPGEAVLEQKTALDLTPAGLGWRGIVRDIGLLLVLTMGLSLVSFSIYSFLPLFLIDRHGVAFQQAGVLAGIMVGVGIVGSPLGGALSDRIGRDRVILFSVISAGPLLYLLTISPMGLWFLGVLVVFGIAMSLPAAATESLMADHVPGARLALALATYHFFNQESSSVMNPVVGRLIDLHGMDRVFRTLAISACVASVVALGMLRRAGKRSSGVR